MRSVLSGALSCGFLVVALHFGRFWLESRDKLFVFFGVAFLLLGLNSFALGLSTPSGDLRVFIYGLRLAAFLLILWGIFDKNRR